MESEYVNFPNVTWSQFSVCNDNATDSFEEMTRSLFYHEFLKEETVPHSDHNQPGIEVEPVLEPPSTSHPHGRLVSFQSKYFIEKISFPQIKHSLQLAAEKYTGKLDHIYLFCNKTITKTNKQYREIEHYLSLKGITLQPISDNDILMLVRKYRSIAEYYFLPRGLMINYPKGMMSTMISTGVTHTISVNPNDANDWKERLTKELLTEKRDECRRLILELKIKEAKERIDYILSFNFEEEDARVFIFYKSLLNTFDGKENEKNSKTAQYAAETEWIEDFYKEPYNVQRQELKRHSPEVQVFAINRMFAAGMWNHIIALFKETDGSTLFTDDVLFQIKFHAGLSFFNLHDFENACPILKTLVGAYHDDKYRLFSLCAEIGRINLHYRNCQREEHDEVVRLLRDLDDLAGSDLYNRNETMIAALSTEAFYNLGLFEERYLDEAIRRIESFSEEAQSNYFVRYFKGLCLEVRCAFDEAIAIYLSLDWKNDEMVASRYMFCLLQNEQFEQIKAVFSQLSVEAKSERAIGVYLFSLKRSNDSDYCDILQESILKCSNSITDLFAVTFYIDDKEDFVKYVLPAINQIQKTTQWNSFPFYVRVNFLLKYARFGLFNEMYAIITSIDNLHLLDNHFINVIYESFAKVAGNEFHKNEKAFEADDSLQWIDLIAQSFVSENVMPHKFLMIRYYCAGAWQKPYSMLNIAKQLYEYDPQTWIARNIVALLSELGERNSAAYMPYINTLKESRVPDHCVVVSFAYRRIGQRELAEYYIYKALYCLNGVNDFAVFRNCFSYLISNISQEQTEEKMDVIKGNTIAILRNNMTKKSIVICFDSESELSDEDNCSLGCIHINPEQWDYTKLMGKKVDHSIKYHQEDYTIISIQRRIDYVFRYIFQKIQESPEEFHGVAWCINATDSEELIEQLKQLTDRQDYINSLIDSYDFKNNDLGLPIDAFIGGDYSRYIDAVRMLLFTKDLIFHAGQPVIDSFESRKFVPALSTLVLLAQMDWLDYLRPIVNDMIIPQSYSVFFQEQYTKACGLQNVSPGTMYFQDGQVMLIEQDKKKPDIWESIIEFCEECSYEAISTEERIELTLGDHISGEQLMSGFKIHVSQMDAIILAKRKNAIYICDDLFFRKLASSIPLENINFVSVMLHYDSPNLFSVLDKLSETNYLLIPYLTYDDNEAMQRLKNHMNGKRKAKYYGQYLTNLSRLVRSVFPEETDSNNDDMQIDIQEGE